MKIMFKLFFVSLAISFLAGPFSALAANSGFGCSGIVAGGQTKTYCSTTNDCSDLKNAEGQPICRNCEQISECDPAGAPPPASTPESTYKPPILPIETGLPVPNAVKISGPGGQGPVGVIANFYSFAFLIAGFLAFVMIVYGGVRYTFSGGSHSSKEEAKESIKQALLGLGLLLVAYLILRTINPDLTELKLPTLDPYNPPVPATDDNALKRFPCGNPPTGSRTGYCDVGGTCTCSGAPTSSCSCITMESTCSVAPLLTSLSPDAQKFENGSTVVWVSSNPAVQKNLDVLAEEYGKLVEVIRNAGGTVKVNSAYRPLSYQNHFSEICDRFKKLQGTMSGSGANRNIRYGNEDPGCVAMKDLISREIRKHGLSSGCVVAPPSACAPHTKGVGIDMTIGNLNAPYPTADRLAQSAGIKLRWKSLSGDPFHFELEPGSIPSPGCVGS